MKTSHLSSTEKDYSPTVATIGNTDLDVVLVLEQVSAVLLDGLEGVLAVLDLVAGKKEGSTVPFLISICWFLAN